MNREIKFRAWDENNDFMFYQNEYGEFERKIDEQRVGSDFSVQDLLFMSFEFLTAMQFTGLKDKNGVEIYEGDLLSDLFPIDEEDLSKGYHESLLPVVWCSKTLQWCVDASFAKEIIPEMTYGRIAKFMGRDHSTAVYSVRALKDTYLQDMEFRILHRKVMVRAIMAVKSNKELISVLEMLIEENIELKRKLEELKT